MKNLHIQDKIKVLNKIISTALAFYLEMLVY